MRGKGLEPKVIFFALKLSNLVSVVNKRMQLKRITERTWCKALSHWVIFVILRPQNSEINPILITFCAFLKP